MTDNSLTSGYTVDNSTTSSPFHFTSSRDDPGPPPQVATGTPADPYLGGLSCITFLIGSIANLVVIVHLVTKFRASRRKTGSHHYKTVELILLLLCMLDELILVLQLSTGASLLNNTGGLAFDNRIYCTVWGISWNVLIRLSVVLLAVLGWLQLTAVLPSAALICGLATYTLLQLLQTTVPFWYGATYKYSPIQETCMWRLHEVFPLHVAQHRFTTAYVFLNILEFLIPVVLCLVFVGVYSYKRALNPSHKLVEEQEGKQEEGCCEESMDAKHPAAFRPLTLTLLLVTSCLLWLPVIFCSVIEISQLHRPATEQIIKIRAEGHLKLYAVSVYSLCITARSWISPLLYIVSERGDPILRCVGRYNPL